MSFLVSYGPACPPHRPYQRLVIPPARGDVDSAGKVLAYLQRYDVAIIRTTEVLYWALFLIVVMFFSSMSTVIGAYNRYKKNNAE